MKPGFKFFSFTSVAALLSCSWCVVHECGAVAGSPQTLGVLGVFSSILSGSQYASAVPPSLFRRRLGAPMPQLGRPISLDEDEDSDEEDLLEDESRPRVEPHITPLNRDQCLAKLLCGMSVPVTGGSSKKNYYNEYANIVSKFFEAFPLDDELQSKESIETYDDYSNEDDGKPTRMNSRRKPLNSSRVDATAPTLQLFDLALVDVAKPGEIAKNRTRKAAFEKVSTGNRIARARRIVENLGQKLQTVRQCQSIGGCPFTFKQLREKLKKKEAERISSNVSLPPAAPMWPVNSKRQNEPSAPSFQPKPYVKPHSRPRPLPPTPKPDSQSDELFSPEEPAFPFKDTNKGDDEMEEIFGPPPVSKKPLGFHQGVDENFNYDYNPDKPWRPGAAEGNSYGYHPWKTRPRPQPKPFSRPGNNNDGGNHRLPPRPRPRPGGNPPTGHQKRYPAQHQNQQNQQNRRPPPRPTNAPIQTKTAPPATSTTTIRSAFPKRKISYLNSPYGKPNLNGDDDEGSEDINKVAPVELIGSAEAGEPEPSRKKTTTTEKPEPETESTTASSKKKKKKDDDDDSDEYDDDDYNDDNYDDDEDALDEEDEDDYSDEEEADKEAEARKKRKKERERRKKKKDKKKEEKEEDDEEKPSSTTPTTTKKKQYNAKPYYDDENEDIHDIWTKLNFATTGAKYKPPEKLKKKQKTRNDGDEATAVASEEDDNEADDDDEEDDDEGATSSVTGLQKIRASSSSASNEDETDDELDEENASKPKRNRNKSKTKVKPTPEKNDDEEIAADEVAPPESVKEEKGKDKKSKKAKKSKKKKKKKGSSEEDDSAAARRKQIMMEIGGRPLVPKPEQDKTNAQKTSSLMSNRFKFQFINPYGPAPPSDANLPGAYTPLRSTFGATSAPSSGSLGSAAASAVSSLPFKFKINPGPLGNLAGGAGMVPLGGFPSMGSSSSASGSIEMPDPHHPPPSNGYIPPPQKQQHQQRQDPFALQPGAPGGGIGGSGLFNLNPIPAISKFFKRPSSGFDSMSGADGRAPPPPNAFIHRPVGPESSHFKRDRPSPASGSSNPASNTSGGPGATKKSTKYKASKGRKGKL